jgi:hypothetical protein
MLCFIWLELCIKFEYRLVIYSTPNKWRPVESDKDLGFWQDMLCFLCKTFICSTYVISETGTWCDVER